LLLAALLACGASRSRVPRQIGTVEGLVVSNSPMLLTDVAPEEKGDRLVVTYSVLFENQGFQVVTLRLLEATTTVADERHPARCSVYGRPSQKYFPPGDRWRVDCVLEFGQSVRTILLRNDADAHLELPFSIEGRLGSAIFKYPLRIEDAT
jgi:hypothetical protein